jgi:hypothetical protein
MILKAYSHILFNKIIFILFVLFASSCANSNQKPKPHLQWVHGYMSTYQDKFTYQHRVYSMQVGQWADSLQPIFQLPFCHSNFHLPEYFCTDSLLISKPNDTISWQTDTTKDKKMRTTTTLMYDNSGKIKNLIINGQKDVYEANYIYNELGKITIINERNSKIEIQYDSMGNITNMVSMDGLLKPLEKLTLEYEYD